MSKNGKSAAWKADKAAAQEAEAKLKNNPFEPETRPHRMFESIRRHSTNMDFRFEEMEEAYGTIGTPRVKSDNPTWLQSQSQV